MVEKIKDIVVYVVTYSTIINTRVQGVLNLYESFGDMILVTQKGVPIRNSDMLIGAYPNPLGLLRVLGLHKIKSVLEKYIYFPSPTMLYVWKAEKILKKRIKHDLSIGKKVCLLTCVPPHDIAILGLHLKSAFPEINWVVDWQDFWSYDEYYFNRIPSFYRKRLLELEKQIFLNCDTNVTTNIKAKALLEDYYNIPSRCVKSIPHHFYRSGSNELNSKAIPSSIPETYRTFNIGFLGNLFKLPKMPGPRVVEAFKSLKDSGFDIKLHIFGDQSPLAKDAADSSNGSIVLYPLMSHRDSMKMISDCDFLLLAMSELPNCQVVMNIKLPHYLLLGKPILAMVPEESAVSDIIRQTRSGYVIPSTSCWSIELKRILQKYLEGKELPERNEIEIEKYSWENISKKWVEVISTQ